jgi:hypothetical protein
METNHIFSDAAINVIEAGLNNHKFWLAYNEVSYFLADRDVFMFHVREEAEQFATNNLSDLDYFRIVYVPIHPEHLSRFLQSIISSPQNNTIMNEQNFEYLKENLKNMGFGDKLNKDMENNIRAGVADFQLKTDATFNGEKMEADLSFRKGEQNEMYFFNKYVASLMKDGMADPEHTQTFYLNRGYGVTFKEAYNLLEGRAVNKDLTNANGDKYNAWVQLDFSAKDKHENFEVKQYHQNYGFDIEKSLNKHPIKELDNVDDRKLLVSSLKKGNLQQVSFEKDGVREKMFIQANPKMRTLTVYDSEKKLVVEQSVKQEKSKGQSGEKENEKKEKKEKNNDKKQERSKTRSKDELESAGQSKKI